MGKKQQQTESILDMPTEQKVAFRAVLEAAKTAANVGLILRPAPHDAVVKALFMKDLMDLMNKWGIWISGDIHASLTSKPHEGQHYALSPEGDFRADDGRGDPNRLAGYNTEIRRPPAPSAHNDLKGMAYQFGRVERFLDGEDGQ